MIDLYQTLGVPRDASHADIQSAYRRAAMRCHPDREGGDEEAFKAVQQAGEILLDPAKRAEYDKTGRVPGQAPTITERVQAMLADIIGKMGEDHFERSLRKVKRELGKDAKVLEREVEQCKNRLDRHKRSAAKMASVTAEIKGIADMREALLAKSLRDAEEALAMMREAQRILSPIEPLPEESSHSLRGLEALMQQPGNIFNTRTSPF